MPAPVKKQKVSLDEVLSKRQSSVRSTPRGDAIVKAVQSPPSWDPENRTAKFVMTSETTDRYGDIVRQNGIQLDRFNENPQALLFHSSRSFPVGKWVDVRKILTTARKRTEGTLAFAPAGGPIPEIDQAAWSVENDLIRTVSIGFIPLEWEAITDEETGYWIGLDFTAAELIECSLVPIPAQPDALIKAAGGDPGLLKAFVEDILDNWNKTPDGLIVPRAEYEKLYQVSVAKLAPTTTSAAEGDGGLDAKSKTEVQQAFVAFLEKALAGDKITNEAGSVEIERGGDIVAMMPPPGGVDVDAAIAARLLALQPAEETTPETTPAETVTPPAVVPEKKAAEAIVVKLDLDTGDAEKSLSSLSAMVDGFKEKIAGIFHRHKPAEERIEPTITIAPTEEEIAAARAKAAATRERVLSKGLN